MKKILLLLFCCFFFNSLSAQIDRCFDGNGGGVPGGDYPPGCFLCTNFYAGNTDGFTPDTILYDFPCGTVENSQWLTFEAGTSDNIFFDIFLRNCTQGIQAVIYDLNLNPVSDCFQVEGSNTIKEFVLLGLTKGEAYYLMIDGLNGDECEFTFFFSMTFSPVENITFDTILCPGDCFQFGNECYYESTFLDTSYRCTDFNRLNLSYADTNNFEITCKIDSFVNAFAFDWSDLGADSFDIFLNDVYQNTQPNSSFLLPFNTVFSDSVNLRVVPSNDLGCSFKTSEIAHAVPNTSDILERNKLENQVVISPNPSKNIFQINSKSKILETTVFDISGRKMMLGKSKVLDLSPFENGIYFFKIQTDEGMVLKRVLKH